MADGQRKYPVDQFIQHHSYGPAFKDTDHDVIAKWYSDIGKNRGYAGLSHSGHFYTPRNGRKYETFAQAQMTGHWHHGKWCVFPLMDDVWHNVAWHAGNWPINQRSIGIENCGNYLQTTFKKIQSLGVANFWRSHDKALKGKTYINPHSQFSATSCPGKIKDAIPQIISYVNNPPKPPVPTDPCLSVKKSLATCMKAKSDCIDNYHDVGEKWLVTKHELEATKEELKRVKGEKYKTEVKLMKCEKDLAAKESCEVVRGMGWTDIFKCKWNIKE